MFQKTFIRFTVFIVFIFTVGILLMAFNRKPGGCEEMGIQSKKAPPHYGEYIIWESMSSTVLSIN